MKGDSVGQIEDTEWVRADTRLRRRMESRIGSSIVVGVTVGFVTGRLLATSGWAGTVPSSEDLAVGVWAITALIATLTISLVTRAGATSQWRSDTFELSFLRRIGARLLLVLATVEVGAATVIWFATPLGAGWAAAWVIGSAAVSVVIAGAAPDEPSLTAQRAIEHERYLLGLYVRSIREWRSLIVAATPRRARTTPSFRAVRGGWPSRMMILAGLAWRGALVGVVAAGVSAGLGAWLLPTWWTMLRTIAMGLLAMLWWSCAAPYCAAVASISRRDSSRWPGVLIVAVLAAYMGAGALVVPVEADWVSEWGSMAAGILIAGLASLAVPLVLVRWPAKRTGRWMACVLWATVWPMRVVCWRNARSMQDLTRSRLVDAEHAQRKDSRIIAAALGATEAEPTESVGGSREAVSDVQDWRGGGYL
ncbi:hypothetical protein [Gordonia sp. N1V]|uniref:hypothetical protein n=1 Tax=Gordonia sp. N1V TaxID=3034163 RepID=UPI0023E1BB1D|nr:hypothetical protein [Gordonia sp. N1V]MDF3285017.1 hypothetical protein [Gordonia sp. N1V]